MTSRALIAMSAIVFSVQVGCSGAPTSGGTGGFEASGGSVGNGGTTSSGGTVGSGGGNGSGGTVSSGGSVGSGGTTSSGGSAGSGGSSGSGGGPGSGGRTGSGGTTGSGGSDRNGGATGSGGTTSSGGTTASAGGGGSGGRPGSGGTTGSGGTGRGGATGSGGAPGTGGATAAGFDWGTTTYNPSGGQGVAYQGHFTGQTCINAACHRHNIGFGGTLYQANGTSTAGNVQIGIRIGGNLVTAYSGSQGNFYGNLSGASWATAQIAVRNASGTVVMPANASASGECNSCHGGSNRILAP